MTPARAATLISSCLGGVKKTTVKSKKTTRFNTCGYSFACLGLAAMAGTKEIFAANLRALLDAPNSEWTAAKLARELHVARSTVTSWLKASKFPRPEQLDTLSTIFKQPVLKFFADASDTRSTMTPQMALKVLERLVEQHETRSASRPTHRPKLDEL